MHITGEKTKNLGSPVWIIFVTLIIFLASQILIAPVIVGLAHLIFNPHGSLDLDKSIPAQFLFILAAEASSAWLTFKIVKRRKLGLTVIGLGRWPDRRDIWPAALGFGVFYLLLIIAGVIINIFAP